MKRMSQILCFLLCSPLLFGQEGFEFTSDKNKIRIPFKLVNNLIIIPIEVNGVELNFLLDTGVEETLLFSLDEKEEVKIYDVQKIKLRGMGSEAPIEALKSSKNTLTLPGLKSENHTIYIVLDQEFNFSSSLGIQVNGIIGYHFFKNNLVEINFSKRKIYVYREDKARKRDFFSKYESLDFTLEKAKPYILTSVLIDTNPFIAKCLIDTGNSDSVWLFEDKSDAIKVPEKNFDDFLGRGFSGSVHGKRAKIASFMIKDFEFKKPITSFPDSVSIKNVSLVQDRLGSVGGELLKRFNVIFDYKNQRIYLKKNHHFNNPFRYNISGIEVHHVGLQWINEVIPLRTHLVSNSQESHYTQKQTSEFKYNFQLKPLYEIVSVRQGSPAEKAGLIKGDVLVSINKKHTYKLSLQEINTLLKANAGDYIFIEIKRKDKAISFKFQLQELL